MIPVSSRASNYSSMAAGHKSERRHGRQFVRRVRTHRSSSDFGLFLVVMWGRNLHCSPRAADDRSRHRLQQDQHLAHSWTLPFARRPTEEERFANALIAGAELRAFSTIESNGAIIEDQRIIDFRARRSLSIGPTATAGATLPFANAKVRPFADSCSQVGTGIADLRNGNHDAVRVAQRSPCVPQPAFRSLPSAWSPSFLDTQATSSSIRERNSLRVGDALALL